MRILLTAAIAVLAAHPAAAQQEVHVHGTGKLLIAIEGGSVEAQLQAPANDIVGFEHAPSDDADRSAVADAAARLKDGGAMVTLPGAAGCELREATVESPLLEEHGDDHDKDHGHGHDKDHDDEHAGHDDEEKETHSEFVAHYRFDCADPEALTRVATGYFQAFPRGRELEVVVLSERGQASGELTPDATSFAF